MVQGNFQKKNNKRKDIWQVISLILKFFIKRCESWIVVFKGWLVMETSTWSGSNWTRTQEKYIHTPIRVHHLESNVFFKFVFASVFLGGSKRWFARQLLRELFSAWLISLVCLHTRIALENLIFSRPNEF